MFPLNTVLKRTEGKTLKVKNAQGKEVNSLDPMNEVRVLAVSPTKQSSLGEWQGETGDCVVVTPVKEFGANENIPVIVLEREYEVVTWGDDEIIEDNVIAEPKDKPVAKRQTRRLLSPEAQFAQVTRDELKKAKSVEA